MNIFVCQVPFQYYTFKSIYRNLENSYFIIPPLQNKEYDSRYGGGVTGTGSYEYLKNFLESQNVPLIDYGERTTESLAQFLNDNAKNVIISHWFEGVDFLKDLRIIGIKYGLANKSSSGYSLANFFFMDLILTYGSYSANRYSNLGLESAPIGNSIFDDWFNNCISINDMKYIEKRLDKKPTILYLPTFGSFSSLDEYYRNVISLTDKYNIIIKLHHCTFIGEANRLCKLLSYPELIVLGDWFDPLPLYRVADLVLVDNSGAVYDALLLEKPVLMLGCSLGDGGYAICDSREETYSVDKCNIVPSVESPNELEKLVDNNINMPIKLNDELRSSLFFNSYGGAGIRAAEAILDDRKYPAIPSLEKYDSAIQNALDEKTRNYILNKRNQFLNKYHHLPVKKPNILKRVLNRLPFFLIIFF